MSSNLPVAAVAAQGGTTSSDQPIVQQVLREELRLQPMDGQVAAPSAGTDHPDTLAAASDAQDPVAPSDATWSPSDVQDDIVVTGRKRSAADPLEAVNVVSYKLTQKVDDAITAPAARLYVRVTPKPVRSGFRHFLNNLREPVVFANFLLQHRFGKAAETVGRFAINSTLGVAGVVDVARRCPFNLPWRPNGFSDTLGVYGVKPGPFLFIPLLGPTTVRDLAGGFVDRLASPFALGGVFRSKPYLITTNVYRLLDRRAEQEDELQTVRDSADPYVARRELYLKKRQDRVNSLRGGGGNKSEGATVSQDTSMAKAERLSTGSGGSMHCRNRRRASRPAPDLPGEQQAPPR